MEVKNEDLGRQIFDYTELEEYLLDNCQSLPDLMMQVMMEVGEIIDNDNEFQVTIEEQGLGLIIDEVLPDGEIGYSCTIWFDDFDE